jgi:benzodiazapine receptor
MVLDTRRRSNISRLIASIVICHLAGVFGSAFTTRAIPTWYASINKPWFTPPDWVFAPVWLALYTLMGISLYLVWREHAKGAKSRVPLIAFAVQLALNAAWSAAFFGLHSPLAGLVIICALLAALGLAAAMFARVSRPAGLLLVPYVLWVAFAAVLNASIYVLNR